MRFLVILVLGILLCGVVGCSSKFMKSTPLFAGSYSVGYNEKGAPVNPRSKHAVRVEKMTYDNLPPADWSMWPFALSRTPMLTIMWPFYEHNDEGWALRPFVYKNYVDTESIYTMMWLGGYAGYPTSSTHWFAPLYFAHSDSDKQTSDLIALLGLGGVTSNPSKKQHWAFPLYTYGTDSKGPLFTTMLGLGGYKSNPTDSKFAHWAFPLYTYGTDSKGPLFTTMLGLGGYNSAPADSKLAHWAFPLYFYNRNSKQCFFSTLGVFAGAQKSLVDSSYGYWFFPLAEYNTSPQKTSFNLLVSLVGMRDNDTRFNHWGLPLYFSHYNKLKDKHTLVAMCGLGGASSDSVSSASWALPFYTYGTDSKGACLTVMCALGGYNTNDSDATHWALPFYLRTVTPERTRNHYFASLCGNSFYKGKPSGFWAHPFFFSTRDNHDSNYNTQLSFMGFWGRDQSGTSLHSWTFPFYLFFANDKEKYKTLITPLGYYTQNDKRKSSSTLFPLGYYAHSDKDSSSTLVLPIGFYSKGDDYKGSYSYYFAPLTGGSDKGTHFALFPISGWTNSAAISVDNAWLFPFIYTSEDERDFQRFDLPFPLCRINTVNTQKYPKSSAFGVKGLFACQSDLNCDQKHRNSAYGLFGLGYTESTRPDTPCNSMFLPESVYYTEKTSDFTTILGVTRGHAIEKTSKRNEKSDFWNIGGLLNFSSESILDSGWDYAKNGKDRVHVKKKIDKSNNVAFPFVFQSSFDRVKLDSVLNPTQDKYGDYDLTVFPCFEYDKSYDVEYGGDSYYRSDFGSLFWLFKDYVYKRYDSDDRCYSENTHANGLWTLLYNCKSFKSIDRNNHNSFGTNNYYACYFYKYAHNNDFTTHRFFPFFTRTKYANGNAEHISWLYQSWKEVLPDSSIQNDDRAGWGLFYSHQSLIDSSGETLAASSRVLREFYHYKKNRDGSENLITFPFINWDRSADKKSSKFGIGIRFFRHVEEDKHTSAVDVLFIPVYRKSWFE